jgi:hypothetical protein
MIWVIWLIAIVGGLMLVSSFFSSIVGAYIGYFISIIWFAIVNIFFGYVFYYLFKYAVWLALQSKIFIRKIELYIRTIFS